MWSLNSVVKLRDIYKLSFSLAFNVALSVCCSIVVFADERSWRVLFPIKVKRKGKVQKTKTCSSCFGQHNFELIYVWIYEKGHTKIENSWQFAIVTIVNLWDKIMNILNWSKDSKSLKLAWNISMHSSLQLNIQDIFQFFKDLDPFIVRVNCDNN